MVTVIDYKSRRNKAGETFFVLVLQAGVEILRSLVTGRLYATARKATVACTFSEENCKQLLGSQLPGRIEKVKTNPYQYLIPGTQEKVMLDYTYLYKDTE